MLKIDWLKRFFLRQQKTYAQQISKLYYGNNQSKFLKLYKLKFPYEVTKLRVRSSVWIERLPSKQDVAGSNPVGPIQVIA